TVVVAPATMKKQLVDADHFMRAGDMVQLEALDVLAVPAYNVDKKFHHAEDGWLGYVFSVAGTTFYHAGDTDFLPSMADIRCDVAFLPCGGHYTMGVEGAARAAEACGAEVLVPIHWGSRTARAPRSSGCATCSTATCPCSSARPGGRKAKA